MLNRVDKLVATAVKGTHDPSGVMIKSGTGCSSIQTTKLCVVVAQLLVADKVTVYVPGIV